MTVVGPVAPLRANEEGCSQWEEAQPVDPSRLLVKAWEDKVFPVIRRRFRSQTDRQSGLEQIKGALLAGKGSLRVMKYIVPSYFCFPLYFIVRLAWCAVGRICHREAALYVNTALEHLVCGLLTGFLLKY